MNLKRWIASRREATASAARRRAASSPTEGLAPMSVPGYGSPPVTRPLGHGPEPSTYGLPPRAPELPPKRRHEH